MGGIQGVNVSSTAPTNGQVLTYNAGATQWEPQNAGGGHTHSNLTALDATTASFTTADETKLDGIEAAADVTDATNVAAAGAVMETDTSTASMQFVVDEDKWF